MKTSAFLIRVGICCLVSLIPMSELENRIYSTRLGLRGHWKNTPEILIVEVDSAGLMDLGQLKAIRAHSPGIVFNVTGQIIPPDSDGVIRRSALIHPNGEPSLAYLAELHVNPETSLASRPMESLMQPQLINFVGPAGSVARCRLYSATERCGEMKGKIVLLTEIPAKPQLVRTPVGEMSPAEVLANEIYTFVFRNPIYYASFLERTLLIAAMVLLGAFYIMYYPVLFSSAAVSATGFGVVVLLFQIIFHAFSIYIPATNIGFALLVTYLVFTGYRLAFQENIQWRTIKQSQYLRELDQLKSNFISLLSHDLKTPIAKIQAVNERLKREVGLPSEERSDWMELLNSIENSSKELNHYVTSVLNLSKIESQKVTLNKKSNDINFLIEQALKRLKPLAQQKNITIEKELDPLFSIECDEELLRQVLTNLIDNAIKYSPEGSRVIVRSQEEDGFVRVDVEDFGPGIPKNQLPLMFRKFSRLLRPVHEQVKGTGLGLYLSKYFIELHGGQIRLKTLEGRGTTFTFTLPIATAQSTVANPVS